ncbi:MAG: Tellurium resistance protein terZ [Candidatus Contendobacter odensis]|uniref:Tellurium resistance protein terZ n=1 Tax=Candidatus Contendibacter odensensis TaxID=1400860 RepID=A0A2G6PFH3_9GAMM|nr:MAG: Tellurium resistance protein terZ [Candidatus Contendobacter odensis]
MAINLQKGQRISLEKEAGRSLNQVTMGLGWGMKEVQRRSFLGFGGGTRQKSVDLDASCLLFDAGGNLVDTVWFRQLKSRCGSIQHSGDDRSGGGEEGADNEQIMINLNQIPATVQALVFTVNSFTGEGFAGIPDAFCRLVDNDSKSEIAHFKLSLEGGSHTGLVMTKLYRHNNDWKLHAIGEQADGRTFHDLMPAIQPHL